MPGVLEQSDSFNPNAARLSSDPILTALAQLATHRLNCDRSFISLIDSDKQHIVAEATRSVSLFHGAMHGHHDGLAFGAGSIPVEMTVCLKTMPVFLHSDGRYNQNTENVVSNPEGFLIRDFSKHDTFKDRPYVQDWPYMRFYMEVPLRTASGLVLGSICVVHNETRPDLTAEENQILEDLSVVVSQHLELLRIRDEHIRVSKLLDGLNSFVANKNRPPMDNTRSKDDPSLPLRDLPKTPPTATRMSKPASVDSEDASEQVDPSLGSQEGDTSGEPLTTQALETGIASFPNENDHHEPGRQHHESLSSAAASSEVLSSFTRAASVLREALDTDGLVFLKGSSCSLPLGRDNNNNSEEITPNARQENKSSSNLETSYQVHNPDEVQSSRSSSLLGLSLRQTTNSTKSIKPWVQPTVPERALFNLISRYPNGQIFVLDTVEGAADVRSRDNEDDQAAQEELVTQALEKQELQCWFTHARSVIFLPLWTPHSKICFAACFAWTNDPKRVYEMKELTYLVAFGHSVMAEVSRSEMLASDKLKSNFISSISHEFRSPLHGILGSAELLRDLSTVNEQLHMISMIETCGQTLLDTMNHLLDYTKINDLTNKSKAHANSDTSISGAIGAIDVVSEFDMRAMVEELVEAMLAGHRFIGNTHAASSIGRRPSSMASPDLGYVAAKSIPTIILTIDESPHWVVKSEPGAWGRILINLLGNALKYTTDGYIEVSLRASSVVTTEGRSESMITLSVDDSGKGISQAYLQQYLYTAFAQEDSLSTGTGLGLSIVKQIVDSLGGTIGIQSEVGCGTRMSVQIPTMILPEAKGVPVMDSSQLFKASNLNICLLGFSQPARRLVPPFSSDDFSKDFATTLAMETSLERHLKQWFHPHIVFTKKPEQAWGDIIFVMEEQLHRYESLPGNAKGSIGLPQTAFLVVICKDTSFRDEVKINTAGSLKLLNQPLGPGKIAQFLLMHSGDRQVSQPLNGKIVDQVTSIDNGVSAERQITESLDSWTLKPTPSTDVPNTLPSMNGLSGAVKPHVLVVDDNPINLKMLVVYMQKLGCDYATATNGLEAVKRCDETKRPFDYILMDISMPVLDGFGATRAIRAHERSTEVQPAYIAALTGLGSDEARQAAVDCGIDIFLIKPISLKALTRVLHVEAGSTRRR
ncbi:hypothetical protein MMC25_000545 [Agyrium rufum]|nr:hypothetical protein [Agyrium rufum]